MARQGGECVRHRAVLCRKRTFCVGAASRRPSHLTARTFLLAALRENDQCDLVCYVRSSLWKSGAGRNSNTVHGSPCAHHTLERRWSKQHRPVVISLCRKALNYNAAPVKSFQGTAISKVRGARHTPQNMRDNLTFRSLIRSVPRSVPHKSLSRARPPRCPEERTTRNTEKIPYRLPPKSSVGSLFTLTRRYVCFRPRIVDALRKALVTARSLLDMAEEVPTIPSTSTLDHIVHLSPPGPLDDAIAHFEKLGFV